MAALPRLRKRPRAEVSLWQDAWRRLLRNRLAVLGGLVIVALGVMAIAADLIAPYHYTKANFLHAYEFPNRDFPLGTDPLGRDMLSRIIYGARISMLVGFVAQFIVVSIGVPIGAVSAYYGGKVDLVIMRFVPVTETASANGLNSLLRSIGTALSSATVAAVLTSSTLAFAGRELPDRSAFHWVFVLGTLVGLVAAGLAAALPAADAPA